MVRRVPLPLALALGVSALVATTPALAQQGERTSGSGNNVRVLSRQQYTDKQKQKMAEIAQRPDVQAEIDEKWNDLRYRHVREAFDVNTARGSLYPNPIVNDYVNQLGQRLVPNDSPNMYAFKLLLNPMPEAYSLTTGTIYVSTGLVSMLDNEAQLAYVLAHEMAHVEMRHEYERARGEILEEKLAEEEQRAKAKKKSIFGAIGAIAGGVIGGAIDSNLGSGIGTAVGALAGMAIGGAGQTFRPTGWDVVHEDEADSRALELMLTQKFDPREVPKTYARLDSLVARDNRIGLGFMGDPTRVRERTALIQKALAGPMNARISAALNEGGLVGGSPEFALLLSALKRDNGVAALQYDLFAMAKDNLEEAARLRSNDPRVHYYLGVVTSMTARTEDERKAASGHFLTAMRYDAKRGTYPEPYLQHALHLIKQNDPGYQGEITNALKTYVMLYQRQHEGHLPPNMHIIYDYFLLAGEENWSIPPFQFVSTEHFAGPAAAPAAAQPAAVRR